MKIRTIKKQMLSDLTTPVSIFLKLRERYAEVLLLESSDYSSIENSQSFLCFDSLQTLTVSDGAVAMADQTTGQVEHREATDIVAEVTAFVNSFTVVDEEASPYSGVFGYTNFDAVRYFDTLDVDSTKPSYGTPDIRYDFYKYVIVFDHFYERLTVLEHLQEGEESKISRIINLINKQDSQTYVFEQQGDRRKNMADSDFVQMVTTCKEHCQRGDVFQVVPSRRFSQAFSGDDFNVYRALRAINPSPYLFYFDYGSYKIFGSSPEAQIVVKGREAEIHPIAGTFKRTGDFKKDQELALQLSADPKENAEHTMLVDLARNDLSKHTRSVHVDKYKEVQYFSHVIHLTSVVKGTLVPDATGYQILADTFPAGTLSGAPKYRALQLIDSLEPTKRGYYGGGIGMIGLNGDINHAIMIRSFFSTEGVLHCQAGAGIVIDSDEQKEMEEVTNKLAALMQALQLAETL